MRCMLTPLFVPFLILGACTTGNQSIEPPRVTLELNPGENNPRNSEGDFITLNDGTVMFIYSKYTGESSSDHAPASLVARYSRDEGKTWTVRDEIIVANEGGMNVMSVSLLRLQNGNIALFYLRKNSTEDCIPMMRISDDEAQSWSDPIVCIQDKPGYYVLNNDRVIQLESGRLLMAVARHNGPGEAWKNAGSLFAYYSDDNGLTWTSGKQVPNDAEIVTQEPGLIEMEDGRVMMYIRASGGFQQLSFSEDKGETWSPIQQSNIPSPLSPATIERMPDGNWLLVWNNNDGSNPEIAGKRTPLTAAISSDEGQTWKHINNIEDDPNGWYCYIALHFLSDDELLLGYCAGNREKGNGLAVTHVTKVSRGWLEEE